MVHRIYVEKKPAFAVEAEGLLYEIRHLLRIKSVTGLRLLNRYDAEGISDALFSRCIGIVFSEPQLDATYADLDAVLAAQPADKNSADAQNAKDATAQNAPTAAFAPSVVFATEYLPGQFDQRAASAAECVQLLSQGERPAVATARVFVLSGNPSDTELAEIKKYVINPVEAREASLGEKATLHADYAIPTTVETLTGFSSLSQDGLADFIAQYGLAMDAGDIKFCQNYFAQEQRDPTLTEIRMIDTYWCDHCRHTTFGTILDEVSIADPTVRDAYDRYTALRKNVHGEKLAKKPLCLMDLATIGGKALKQQGVLTNLDESDEINACSVKITVDNNGTDEPWLLLFKNETHNHPTEIEPFGGAATCIGGAIRDPLANRGYVYQAMRVTGAGDPLVPVKDTLPGKLPQRKLVKTAAAGYSSYGNQIGLATGIVDELYHPGYVAKRMEIGAVVGAVPEENVRREEPLPGDIVILLGGRTGRDGCGGATGSSKAHKKESLATCGAEVQKGNAPVERKLQRLFRTKQASLMIKRCNDFGAGGVSVAIGELADGLIIDLDKVPKKYDGLDGTELAISESQERMAVVVDAADAQKLIDAAARENLEATAVATVTEQKRLVMRWQGNTICDIDRAFLNSNGAEKHITATVAAMPDAARSVPEKPLGEMLTALMGDLNICSKKGLAERFDATIGAGSVVMPFGGKTQLTPVQAMAAKLPVLHGETKTCSGMAWGFNPFIAQENQYAGAYLAVLESVAKLVAAGFSAKKAALTFQEYFERLGTDPARWGKPLASLLGALDAQLALGVAAIGGKDSMSGSFETIDVPPTLVSFAIAPGETQDVITPEFKLPGSKIVLLQPAMRSALLPEAESQTQLFSQVETLMKAGKVLSAWTPGLGGVAEGLVKMCLGNRVGFHAASGVTKELLFGYRYGSFILELADEMDLGITLGETTGRYTFEACGETVSLDAVQAVYENTLEPVLPYHSLTGDSANGSDDASSEQTPVDTLQ
ncbi:MAG: phosphoribosylformylglycinamidine synthase, partial [Ruthenibacterium sp.]